MGPLSAIRLVWLLVVFDSVLDLTMKTPSVQWSSLLPSDFFSLWLLLEVGFFVSLMFKMLFFMVS